MEVEHILMAYKGGAEDEETLRTLCHLVRAWRARLTIVHVLEVSMAHAVDDPNVPGVAEAEQTLKHAEEIAHKEKIKVHADLVQARDAGMGIVEEAEYVGADLIVASARTEKQRLLGSPISDTIQYVMEHAPCAVWLNCPPIK